MVSLGALGMRGLVYSSIRAEIDDKASLNPANSMPSTAR